MSTTTTNLNMVLNEGQDKFSIPTLNENLTKIDTAIGEQNKNKVGFDWRMELLDCTANTIRYYTFPNMPEHKTSFPVLADATGNLKDVVVAKNLSEAGGIKILSPITQQVQVALIILT